MAMIISGFPGIGKSYYCEAASGVERVVDSDSSKFSWLREGVRHPDFPQDYIDRIKTLVFHGSDLILVSSHKVVRDALVANGLRFTPVFPKADLKDEYINRFVCRGDDANFIRMIDDNWDSFMSDMAGQEGCEIIRLESGEYLGDYLKRTMRK